MSDAPMKDLVLRLRKAYTSLKLCQGLSVGYGTFSEAADEIERLRETLVDIAGGGWNDIIEPVTLARAALEVAGSLPDELGEHARAPERLPKAGAPLSSNGRVTPCHNVITSYCTQPWGHSGPCSRVDKAPPSVRDYTIAAQIAHAALHILDDWAEENAQTGEAIVEIPAHEWKELNRVIDLLGAGDFGDAHDVLHNLIGVNEPAP